MPCFCQRVPQIVDAIIEGHMRKAVRFVNGLEMKGLERIEEGADAELVSRLEESNLRDCISRSYGKEQVCGLLHPAMREAKRSFKSHGNVPRKSLILVQNKHNDSSSSF
jgi:hypothetical protein